jgi:hypothetical protein
MIFTPQSLSGDLHNKLIIFNRYLFGGFFSRRKVPYTYAQHTFRKNFTASWAKNCLRLLLSPFESPMKFLFLIFDFVSTCFLTLRTYTLSNLAEPSFDCSIPICFSDLGAAGAVAADAELHHLPRPAGLWACRPGCSPAAHRPPPGPQSDAAFIRPQHSSPQPSRSLDFSSPNVHSLLAHLPGS